MVIETIFRILFVLVLLLVLSIRGYYHSITASKVLHGIEIGDKVTFKEGWLGIILRSIFGLIWLASVVAYLVMPQWMKWATLPLWIWLRWIGIVVTVPGVLLLAWAQHILGENFSATLHVREKHTLVTSGPYRWMRHPIYTALYLVLIAFLLLTANWFIGLLAILGLTLVLIVRVRREEGLMIETFGDQYRKYMAQTGRFLPRLSR